MMYLVTTMMSSEGFVSLHLYVYSICTAAAADFRTLTDGIVVEKNDHRRFNNKGEGHSLHGPPYKHTSSRRKREANFV